MRDTKRKSTLLYALAIMFPVASIIAVFLLPWLTSLAISSISIPFFILFFYTLSILVVLYLRDFYEAMSKKMKLRILTAASALTLWSALALPPLNGQSSEHVVSYGFPSRFLNILGLPPEFPWNISFDPIPLVINLLSAYLLLLLFYKFMHSLLNEKPKSE